jgi:hypothetical protein
MIRRAIHPIALTLAVVPLFAAVGRANSITTYGIIITTLGNDLQVQSVDKAEAAAAVSGNAVSTAVGGMPATESGVLITPNGSGGLTVLPFGGSIGVTPLPSSGGAPAAGGGSDGGVTKPITGDGSGAVSVTQQVPVPSNVNVPPAGSTTSVTDTQPVPVPAPPSVAASSPPPPTAKTPEPASVSLLAIAACGGIGMVRRRRS